MKSNKIVIIILIIVTLLGCLSGLLYFTSKDRANKAQMQTFTLGEATMPGYIGAEVYYDTEPVDVALISPSGRTYTRNYTSVYNIDPTTKTITVLVDCDDLGEWKISTNTLGNKQVKFKFMNTTSPTLYLTNTAITQEDDGRFYVKFCPIMTVIDDESVNYSLVLNGAGYSYPLTDGNGVTRLNETSYILLNPPENAYDGREYTIHLSVRLPDGSQTRSRDLRIHLTPAEEVIISTEPASETEFLQPGETSDTE